MKRKKRLKPLKALFGGKLSYFLLLDVIIRSMKTRHSSTSMFLVNCHDAPHGKFEVGHQLITPPPSLP